MADTKNFFAVVILVMFAVLCFVSLYTFSLANAGIADTGQLPLVAKATEYQARMQNVSYALTNSTRATLDQNPFINVANNFVASTQTGMASFQLIYDSFALFIDIITTTFASPAFAWLPAFVIPMGIIFVGGGFVITVLGVALRWWV